MRRATAILTALLLLLPAACGFQLRGAFSLPFQTLYIAQPETSELRAAIKRQVEAATATRVVDDAKQAEAGLLVVADDNSKDILSLSSAGKVREYQLIRSLSFRVVDPKGQDLLAPATIRVTREITFDDTRVLAKESEEALLRRDMQNDIVQQLLRRLAAAKVRPASP